MQISIYCCCWETGLSCSFYVLGLQVNCKILFIENSLRLPQMFIESMLFARHVGESEDKLDADLALTLGVGEGRVQIFYKCEGERFSALIQNAEHYLF